MSDELLVWSVLVAAATLLCVWVVQSVLAVGRRSSVQEVGLSLYLTPALGRTAFLSITQRRAHWQQAVAYINRLIRLRRKFHTLGQYLKQPRVQTLFAGVKRLNGILRGVGAGAIDTEPCPTMPVTPLTRATRRTAAVRQVNS